MKNFDEFLAYLRENPVKNTVLEELSQSDFGFEPLTEREQRLLNIVSSSSAVTIREILRSYHDWLQKPE